MWKPYFPLEKMEPTMQPRVKGPGKSVYTKDYVKHPLEENRDMKNDLWSTFQTSEPIDFGTTMRVAYI